MSRSDLSRYVLAISAAGAMLAGCGGSQPPIGAPGAIRQGLAIPTHTAHGKSWMLPEAKSEDLIYVTNGCGGVCVLTYPQGSLVGSLAVAGAGSVCADRNGNVFVTVADLSNASILEYRHGGMKPIETLSDAPNVPQGCSVDPTTGNLAVANFIGTGWGYDHGNVAIYTGAKGNGMDIHQPNIYWYYFCAYDDAGDLLVDGRSVSSGDEFAELPPGSSQLEYVSINDDLGFPGPVGWDGAHFVIGMGGHRDNLVYRVELSGSTGTIVGKTRLTGRRYRRSYYYTFWIQGHTIVVPYSTNGHHYGDDRLGLFNYPKGGEAREVIGSYNGNVAVSLPRRH